MRGCNVTFSPTKGVAQLLLSSRPSAARAGTQLSTRACLGELGPGSALRAVRDDNEYELCKAPLWGEGVGAPIQCSRCAVVVSGWGHEQARCGVDGWLVGRAGGFAAVGQGLRGRA